MPTKNLTIDNISPLIDYSPKGAWSEGNISDTRLPDYSNGTFTLSVDTGANATFSFNGTAIWLFGAKRFNHGLYNITLDGQTTTMNGYSPGTGIFQTPLFTQTHLTNTLHTITLTNAGLNSNPFSNFLDLDYITWESTFGIGSKQVHETTLQDSVSSFSYQPQGSWNTSPEFLSFFFGQSGHATTTAEASMTLTFSGDTVQIFGTVGPKDAPYSVQLDNGSLLTFNATKYKAYQQVLLYYADNLGPGSHNVKITNKPALPGESLNINYALVDVTLSSSGLSRRAIAGIAIAGAIIIIVALIAGIFFLRRPRSTNMDARGSTFNNVHGDVITNNYGTTNAGTTQFSS